MSVCYGMAIVAAKGYAPGLVLDDLHRQIDEIEGELAEAEDQPR